jgi:hypothetical protein
MKAAQVHPAPVRSGTHRSGWPQIHDGTRAPRIPVWTRSSRSRSRSRRRSEGRDWAAEAKAGGPGAVRTASGPPSSLWTLTARPRSMGDARMVRSVLGSCRGEQPSWPMPLLQGAESEKMGVAEMEALMEMLQRAVLPGGKKGRQSSGCGG